MTTNVHAIHGMHCEACVERLNQAFRAVPGVKSARVTLAPPEVRIESDAPIATSALEQAARGAGEYSLVETAPRPSLYPLFLIVAFIAGIAALTTWFRAATPALDGGKPLDSPMDAAGRSCACPNWHRSSESPAASWSVRPSRRRSSPSWPG